MRWIGHILGATVLFALATPTALAFSPSGWIAERIENYASESFGVSLDIGDLDIDLLSTTPGGSASGVSIGDGAGGTIVSGADLAFEIDAGFLVGNDLMFERLELSNAEIDLVVDEEGRGNWQNLLASLGADEESDPPDSPVGIPGIRSLDIENVEIDYTDRALERSASLTLSASGSTTDPDRPLQLEARGELDELPALAEVTLVTHGDPVAPSGSLGIDGQWLVGDVRLAVEGEVGDPVALDELDLSLALSAPDGKDIEALTTLELPELGALKLDGGIARDDGIWRLREIVASVGDTRVEIDGGLGDPTTAGGLAPDLSFSLAGPSSSDVAPLVEAFTGTELPPLPAFSASGAILGEDGDWTLDGVQAQLGETRFRADGSLGDPTTAEGLAPDLSFSLAGPSGSDVAPLVEAFTGAELPSLPAFSAAGGVTSVDEDWTLRDVDARLGDVALTVSGALGDPLGPDGLDPRLEFTLEAPDLRDIAAITGTELPPLAPIALSGGVRRDGDDWVLRRFTGIVGSSSVEGDARVDPTTAPTTVYANVIVPELHLDELLGVLEGVPSNEVAVASDPESPAGWLPDEPLELRPLTRAVDGAVRVRVRDVVSTSLPLESFAGRLEIDGDEIALSSLRVGVGGGTVGGSIDLDVAPVPIEGMVDLRIRGIDLNEIARTLGIDDDSFGAIGGRAKYWIRGDSLASFAAGADGGLFLLMRGGKLDALLVELASIDLLESVLLLLDPGKTLTNIDCGYVDLQTAAGLTEIEHFVLDTADTLFIADGTIDLADESFDIGFEPHPKDPSLFEINTGVRFSGTGDDFSVVPGIELGAHAVAATALAVIAAPAAALLAFVDTGGAEDSPYCDALVDELDKTR